MLLIYLPNIVSAQWNVEGNSGLPEGVKNFLGTHDNVSVRFITNNIERMRLAPSGNFGIGTNNPQQLLHVNGAIRFQNLSSGTQTTALMIDANGDLSKRTLHTVAFSGSYNDLTNLPSLNIANWNTAFSWGNHATAGYLTSYTETDPVFIASPSYSISSSDITNWNTAHSWGNHAGLYRAATWVPTWDEVTDKPTFATVAISGDYNDLINLPTLFDGNWSSLTGTAPAVSTFNNDAGYIIDADDADANPTNEIQTISLSGQDLTLSHGGGTITLPDAVDDADANPTNEIQTFNLSGQDLTLSHGGGTITLPDAVDDADADPTNEIQDLSINAEFLSISGGSGVSLDGINYWSRLNSNLYYNSGSVGIGINEPNKLLHLHSESTYFPGGGAGPVVGTPIKKGVYTAQFNSESTLLLTNKNSGSEATDGLLIRSYNNNATISLQEEGSLSLITKNPLRFKMQQNGNISIGTHNTNYFTVNENGNVGVGTDEPEQALHIKGNKMLVEQNGNKLYLDADNGGVEIGSSTNQVTFWHAGNYNKIVAGDVITVGNIGAGTNNPSCRLDVNGFGKFGNQSQYIRIGKLGSNLHIDSYDGQLNINRNTNNETYFGGIFKVGDKMKITQNGKIWAQEVKVALNDPYPDYVFKPDYDLISLEELEVFIKNNGHLPNVPSETIVLQNEGFELGAFCLILLEKIEELTLHAIQQEKRIRELENNTSINSK